VLSIDSLRVGFSFTCSASVNVFFFDAQHQHSLDPNSLAASVTFCRPRADFKLLCRALLAQISHNSRPPAKKSVEKGFLAPTALTRGIARAAQFIKFVLGACGINKYPSCALCESIMGDALLQLGTSADITTKGENRTIKYQFLTSLPSLRNMKIARLRRRCSGACVYYIAMRESPVEHFLQNIYQTPTMLYGFGAGDLLFKSRQ
jgi:hypothetical protein